MADYNHTTTSRQGLVLMRPDLLSWRPFGGVNLAIASGMGLIAAAAMQSTGRPSPLVNTSW